MFFNNFTEFLLEKKIKQSAGILLYCKENKKFLLDFRSFSVGNPNTYSVFGGGIEDNENPYQAAIRELVEESGYDKKIEIIPLSTFHGRNKIYYNFLGIIKKSFIPKVSFESAGYKWFSLEDLYDSNLNDKFHHGLNFILDKDKEKLEKYIN